MTPGPDIVVACPGCGALARYQTVNSGNTFRQRCWSDDKVVRPMLPQPPAFVQCHACGNCYWLADADERGAMPSRWGAFDEDGAARTATDPAWRAAPEVQQPTEDAYYSALELSKPADRNEERHLRLLALQCRNDRFRDETGLDDLTPDPAEAGVIATGAARQNLLHLVSLFDAEPAEMQMLKGECLRALGDFEAAVAVFGSVTAAKLEPYATKLMRLSEHRIARVRLIT